MNDSACVLVSADESMLNGEDAREGMAAFVAKRKPEWQGK